jgi:hypothetical protein
MSDLDVVRDALELCAQVVESELGADVDVPDDLDDNAIDGALFDLFCAIRLARMAEARARFLSMIVDADPARDVKPKKPKKAKRPA